jgi:hypothetical protein
MVVDAPSERPQPTGVNRLNACFPVLTCVVRLQGINVLARDCRTTGVQAAPKLSVKTITRNVETLSLRHECDAWQANRKAGRWRGNFERSEKANAAL